MSLTAKIQAEGKAERLALAVAQVKLSDIGRILSETQADYNDQHDHVERLKKRLRGIPNTTTQED